MSNFTPPITRGQYTELVRQISESASALGVTDPENLIMTYDSYVMRHIVAGGAKDNAKKFMQTTPFNDRVVNQELDMVNHPPHYTTGKIEVIDFIEDQKLPFHEAQVIKYVTRARHKGNELEDLKKAAWYLNRLIEQKEKNNETL